MKYNMFNSYVKMTRFDKALSNEIQFLTAFHIHEKYSLRDMYVVLSAEDHLLPFLESKIVKITNSTGLFSYRWKKITLLPPPFVTNCLDYARLGFSSRRQCATRCMNISTYDQVVERDGVSLNESELDEQWDINYDDRLAYCKKLCSRPNCVIEEYKMVEMLKEQSQITVVLITYPLDDDFVAIYKEKLTFIEFTGLFGSVFGLWLGLSVLSLLDIADKTVRKMMRSKRRTKVTVMYPMG
ncbi:hypothetical protein HDE_01913 [Halotydeus destructor]|nr:hypothetical protein HDE_01913 [Halotydeus destructor]